MLQLDTTIYETLLKVRPDDIDMNQHVHSSKYMDYVLAARYDQMERCYNMPMKEFTENGFSWVIKNTFIEYKRPLLLGDDMKVRTHLQEMQNDGCKVVFEILNAKTNKLCSNGYFNYTMVNSKTGRAEKIQQWIIDRYSIEKT